MTVDIGIMFIKLMIKNKIITISKTRTITKTVMMIKKIKIVKSIKINKISMTSMTNKIIMTSITSIIIMTSMIHTKVTYNIKIIKEVETINIMIEMIKNKIRDLKMVIIKKDIRKITTTKNMNKMQIRQKTAQINPKTIKILNIIKMLTKM